MSQPFDFLFFLVKYYTADQNQCDEYKSTANSSIQKLVITYDKVFLWSFSNGFCDNDLDSRALVIDTIQDLNFRLGIKSEIQLQPLIQIGLLSKVCRKLTKIGLNFCTVL